MQKYVQQKVMKLEVIILGGQRIDQKWKMIKEREQITVNHLLVMKKGDVRMTSTETRDGLSTTCNLKVTSRYLSMPDAISLHHCLQNHS